MRFFQQILLVCLMLCFTASESTGADKVRLAVIAERPEDNIALDLLTAELSKETNVTLLERGQIDRLTREHLLAGTQKGNAALTAGKLLGADAVLWLEPIHQNTNDALSIRLVSVKHGVVLHQIDAAFRTGDPIEWANGVSRLFRPWFEKVKVPTQDAVRISVVNLRTATATADAPSLERELLALLLKRLVSERDFFVLERRKLDAASFEKEINADEFSFWSGSFVLDGVIDKNGYSAERLALSCRLMPPGGGVPRLIEVTAPRQSPSELIEPFVEKLLAELRKERTGPPWNAAKEGEQFYLEAKWALHWGMFKEAQTAAEASWALGHRTREVADVRSRSYAVAALPNTGAISVGERDVTFERLPEPEKITSAMRALDTFLEGTAVLSAQNQSLDTNWWGLGVDALEISASVLRHFYFSPEYQRDAKNQLADLRSRCREVAVRISTEPSLQNQWRRERNNVMPPLFGRQGDALQKNIFHVQATCGAFWQETPEQCVAIYPDLMRRPFFWVLRHSLMGRFAHEPLVVGWTEADRKRTDKVWNDFLQGLTRSTNAALQIEAHFLLADEADGDAQMNERAHSLFDCILNKGGEVMQPNGLETYLDECRSILDDVRKGEADSEKREEITKYFNDTFLPAYQKLRDDLPALAEKRNRVAAKRFLIEKKMYDHREFADLFLFTRFSDDEMRDLLPLIEEYKTHIRENGAINNHPKFGVNRATVIQRLDRLQQSWNKKLEGRTLTAKAAVASAIKTNVVSPVSNTPYVHVRRPLPPIGEDQTNIVTVKRLWKVPSEFVNGLQQGDPAIVNLCFREEQLWMEVRGKDRAAIVSVDLDTMETASIPIPPDIGLLPLPRYNEALRTFDVAGGNLFISASNSLRKFNLTNKVWKTIPTPNGSPARVFAFTDRVFLTTAESILEISAQDEVRLIASTRRHPTENKLDELPVLNFAGIIRSDNNEFRVTVGSSAYVLRDGKWCEVLSLRPNVEEPFPGVYDDALLLTEPAAGDAPASLWWWLSSAPQPEKLLQTDGRPQVPFMKPIRSWTPRAVNTALWKPERNLQFRYLPKSEYGDTLWFYNETAHLGPDAEQKLSVKASAGRHGNVVRLARDTAQPVVIPILFDPAVGPGFSEQIRRVFAPEHCRTMFVATPAGLVFTSRATWGFWFVSYDEMNAEIRRQISVQQQSTNERLAQRKAEEEALVTKHKLNNDHVFDASEKQRMFSDPLFFRFDWSNIDTNENGYIDAEESIYFDSDRNGEISDVELEGIHTAQQIVAERMIQKFDVRRDGCLEYGELEDAAIDEAETSHAQQLFLTSSYIKPFDKNSDQRLDVSELQNFLFDSTRRSILTRRPKDDPAMRPTLKLTEINWDSSEEQAWFKTVVEAVWKQLRSSETARRNN